jgi:hypothetical protein
MAASVAQSQLQIKTDSDTVRFDLQPRSEAEAAMTPESVAGLFVGGSVLDALVIRIGLALWPAPPARKPVREPAPPAALGAVERVDLEEAA